MLKALARSTELVRFLLKPRHGFVEVIHDLAPSELEDLAMLIGQDDVEMTRSFELEFAKLLGPGDGLSFAAGRMALHAGLKALGVGPGDEVILPGFTCSVVPNAVLRLGARPVYADISIETFGSSVQGIKACLSSKTKAIVVQHSFGIPCDIEPILELSRQHKLALIEDCALSLGSKLNGQQVGTFGDASFFSMDVSKPLGILTGGFLYSSNRELLASARQIRDSVGNISTGQQRRLYQQLKLFSGFRRPEKYAGLLLTSKMMDVSLKFFSGPSFFESDYSSLVEPEAYPYPAVLPSFLARVGSHSLGNWPIVKQRRMNELEIYRKLTLAKDLLPKIYFDPNREIVPLRIFFTHANAKWARSQLTSLIDTHWFWFRDPIINANPTLDSFGYVKGQCPLSEAIGKKLLNWPLPADPIWAERLRFEFQSRLG